MYKDIADSALWTIYAANVADNETLKDAIRLIERATYDEDDEEGSLILRQIVVYLRHKIK